MSVHHVKVPITPATYQRLHHLAQQLQQGERQSLSKPVGEVFTTLCCEVLDQVFGVLIRTYAHEPALKTTGESEKIIEQIQGYLNKYMPMSMALFGNERLQPVVAYIIGRFANDGTQPYLQYPIDQRLMALTQQHYQQLMNGDSSVTGALFQDLVKVIDEGITALIRQPKAMLKFNLVMNKTLDGVIHIVTNLGYKRIEKVAKEVPFPFAQQYAKHLYGFIHSS